MRRRRELERILATAKLAAERPRYLRIRAEVLIHDRVETAPGPECPGCRSVDARIVERRPLDDLVIDLETGERIRERDLAPAAWRELCEVADLRELPLRMSQAQARLVLDDSPRHLFASGGNRSSKTTAGLIWLTLQWLRRGGPRRRFWLIASTTPKAFELLQKLVIGTGDRPGILPPELIVRRPKTARSSDLQVELADGSLIELKFFEGDPSAERLKSDAVVAALCTEASHLPGPDSLVALEGRCLDLGGRIFLDSTPRPASFLRAAVVEPALAFERMPADDPRKLSGEHEGARWLYVELALLANPWLPLAELEAKLRAMKPDDPAVARDFFGKWTSSAGLLWRDFHVERHVLVHEARDFGDLGGRVRAEHGAADHVDITAKAVALVFGRPSQHFRQVRAVNNRYVLGLDVNCHPLTAVALQVTAPREACDDRERWHFWIVECVQTYQGNSYAHAEKLAATAFGRMLEPGAAASGFKGCGIVADATALARDPTAHRFGGDPLGLAEVFGRQGFDVRAPLYAMSENKAPRPRNPNRKDSHLLVHRLLREGRLHVAQRCEALIESFLNQEDSGDGVEPRTISATRSDRLASPMDALRYPLWAIVHAPAPVRLALRR